MDMIPLTDDEAGLLYALLTFGSDSWPIEQIGSYWSIGPWRSWTGFPELFDTKREAHQRLDAWMDLARERWRAMKAEHPDWILTAVGVSGRTTS